MNNPLTDKDFQNWFKVKEDIHYNAPQRSFNEGEIWWIATGENVGIEINGKGSKFARPVIIFKKLSKLGCFAIPLTSQEHEGPWYTEFTYGKKKQFAALAQTRVISAQRLYRRIGRMSKNDYNKVANGLQSLLFPAKQNTPNLYDWGGRLNGEYTYMLSHFFRKSNTFLEIHFALIQCYNISMSLTTHG